MSTLTVNDFNKICRMCLKEDSTLINIFFSDAAEIIPEITSITMREGDFLPENICILCMDKSTEFYKFKRHCEKSNIKLQSIFALHNEVMNKTVHLDKMITVKIEQDHNQKADSVQTEINDRINTPHRIKLNLSGKGDIPVVQNLAQGNLGLSNNGNQTDSAHMNISIPLRTRNNCQVQIRRSYKDLIPLEAYNNKKKLDQEKDQINNKETFEDNCSQEASTENLEISNDNSYQFENEDTIEIVNDSAELEEIKSTDAVHPALCEYCNMQFDEIQTHLEEYHPDGGMHYCYLCSKLASSSYITVKQLRMHLRYHKFKQLPKFQCELCNKWFRSKYQKKIHMRVHTGERPATCKICDKSFRDPRYLVTHLKSHSGERPFKCALCGKGYGHKFTLKVHLKTHSPQREHMCNICGKTFIYGNNLTIHLRQHTGEKPYTCDLCFTSFVSGSVLNAHMLTHSDKKRFECVVCSKKFKRSGDLKIHMRTHTGEKPYVCTVCSNRYKMTSHLTEHMKTHTGEKNYICEICSKSFYNKKSLEVHKHSHSGQKTYNCSDCDKSFVHHTSLCTHQRKQHKK